MANITNALARESDGTIQITFDIPKDIIEKEKDAALEMLAKEVEIPGFRKGNAPLSKVEASINHSLLVEKTLSKILPEAFGAAIEEYKLKPAIYPKFELVSAEEDKDWQVRAVTCELPEFDLGDYKKIIRTALASAGKTEKEQIVIKTLLDSIKITIPKVLVDEEVNSRLSSLLSRIEKLGLSLEAYLGSIGKTPESLRGDYVKQASEALALDLILNKIALEEKIAVSEEDINKAIEAASADPKAAEAFKSPEQRRLVRSVLTRKVALDSLVSLM